MERGGGVTILSVAIGEAGGKGVGAARAEGGGVGGGYARMVHDFGEGGGGYSLSCMGLCTPSHNESTGSSEDDLDRD